jgi:hypothetical protein
VSTAPPQAPDPSEAALIGAALALGAREVPGWSEAETALVAGAGHERPGRAALARMRAAIAAGGDPLGELFCRLRVAERRRPVGATYTPPAIV